MVYFTSSDPSIASVNSLGVVKAHKTGTVTVTAAAVDGAADTCTVTVTGEGVMLLPAGTKAVHEEAFTGTRATVYVIPEGCRSIASRAFAGLKLAAAVYIPSTVGEIAADAFADSSVTIHAPAGSAAQQFATANGITFAAE